MYYKTLSACALMPDLNVLPAGDQTEIGEKVSNRWNIIIHCSADYLKPFSAPKTNTFLDFHCSANI